MNRPGKRGVGRPFGGGSKSGQSSNNNNSNPGEVHPQLLKQARQSGQLNLSGRGLLNVPNSIWRINEDVPEEARTVSLDATDDRWWEQADLTKLILASNSLSTLSEDIAQLSALTVLDVHDNNLASLPESLGELTQLQRANFSHNKLASVPAVIGCLSNLVILHLQHNVLSELCGQLGDLYSLEELDISNNQLTVIPECIGYLTKLMKLNIAHNKIRELPPELGDLRCLRTFEATHNELSVLPVELGNWRKLELLYLRHNSLSNIPVLTNCTSLKELHLGNNHLQALTVDHLEHMKSVSVLDLRDNNISVLPDEITLLVDLERLDVSNNDLSGLPYVLGTLMKLKSIVLDGNPMRGIRRDIVMRGTTELKKYLRSRIEGEATAEGGSTGTSTAGGQRSGQSGIIGGGNAQLDVHTIHQFKSLDYSKKQVTEVPDDVWEMAVKGGVTSVNLSRNLLAQLPANLILVVSSLAQLNLGFNRLTSLHTDISLYLKLTYLDLRNNSLESLPDDMVSLQNLRELVLSCNRYVEIPKVVYEFGKLEILFAADNKIELINVQGLTRLRNLGTLDLQNNSISQVPPELGNCSWIKSLHLGGNAFRNPRPAILDKGTPALLEYLKGRIVT